LPAAAVVRHDLDMLEQIKRLALQTLDRVDSTGNASRWLLAYARGKAAQPAKTAADYDLARLMQRVDQPLQPSTAFSWSLPDIIAGRDAQSAGLFHLPAEMNASMNADDAIYVAKQARVAPVEAMGVAVEAAGESGKAGRVAAQAAPLFGDGGSAMSKATEKSINRDLADHGVAFGINRRWWINPNGSIGVEHEHWPIRDVCWDAGSERFLAQIRVDGEPPPTKAPATTSFTGRIVSSVPIIDGDGRWVIYQSQAHHSWQHDAAILPGSLVWARHAFGAGDWAAVSRSHGSPKWVGTLSEEGEPIQETDEDGNVVLTQAAKDMLALMADLASLSSAYGLKPYGSKAELIVNTSTAWQVFSELMQNAEKAAARIWTGTDALLGAQGGAPGIDISQLFGVASTIIQGDVNTITRAFHRGVIVPWTALSFGSAALAPARVYQIPDPDLQRARVDYVANETAYVAMIGARRAAQLIVDQRWLDETAKRLGVTPAQTEELLDPYLGRGGMPPEAEPVSEVRPAA
jgi:hypothetical protein